jgi:uncharacterized protein DUF2784
MRFYATLAVGVLALHFIWIVWVIFGAMLTRHRPVLRFFHMASLIYSIFIEVLPWPPCPLTVLEQWLEQQSGIVPYHGPFLIHYLDAMVYPAVPETLLTVCAVVVCIFNLGVYAARYRQRRAAGWK